MKLPMCAILFAATLLASQVTALRSQQLQEALEQLATGTRLNRHGEEIAATQPSSPTASDDSRYVYSPWEFPASLQPSAANSAAQSQLPTAHPSHQSLVSIAHSPIQNIQTPSPGLTDSSGEITTPVPTESTGATSSPAVSPDRPIFPEQKKKGFRRLVHRWAQRFRGCTSRKRPSQAGCNAPDSSASAPSPPPSPPSPPPPRRRRRTRSGVRLRSPGRG